MKAICDPLYSVCVHSDVGFFSFAFSVPPVGERDVLPIAHAQTVASCVNRPIKIARLSRGGCYVKEFIAGLSRLAGHAKSHDVMVFGGSRALIVMFSFFR